MTNPLHRLLIVIADESTSMQSIRQEMQDGLNRFVADRKSDLAPDGGSLSTRVTLYGFNETVKRVYQNRLVTDIPGYELVPNGNTALLDAIGTAVDEEGARLARLPEGVRPGKVIVLVVTDGFENSSRRYVRSKIREMVKRQEEEYGWTFIFMGADQDAITAGADMNISADVSYSFASTNTAQAWTNTSGMVARGTASGTYAYTGQERDEVK